MNDLLQTSSPDQTASLWQFMDNTGYGPYGKPGRGWSWLW